MSFGIVHNKNNVIVNSVFNLSANTIIIGNLHNKMSILKVAFYI